MPRFVLTEEVSPIRTVVPLDLAKRLRERAERNDRSLSAEIRRVLRESFEGEPVEDHPRAA